MNSDASDFMDRNANRGNMWLIGSAPFKGYVTFVEVGTTGKMFCEFGSSLFGGQKYYDFEEFVGTNVIRRFATRDFGNGPDSLWEVRKPFVSLGECCVETKGHIAHYVFNDMVMRELCSFMGAEVTPLSLAEVEALGPLGKTTVVNIRLITSTGKYIYTIDNVVYSEHFPIEWALNPMIITARENRSSNNGDSAHIFRSFTEENGEGHGVDITRILGPGTSRKHCKNCSYCGSSRGVFLGYCASCAQEYGFERGVGFGDRGIYLGKEPANYLQGVDVETLGYYVATDEKYNSCLSGGELPTGPDICDNQDHLDPINEDVVDEYITSANAIYSRISKRYPRRAYGLPGFTNHSVVSVDQTSKMTPDFIRDKMEIFFAENGIEITDNNYSFPIGPRPEWDHYRVTKRPSWWFAWNAVLRSHNHFEEDVKLEIRLYVSNVHSDEHPAKIQLDCNNVRGRSQLWENAEARNERRCSWILRRNDEGVSQDEYWDMVHSMKSWILDETDNPLIVIPPPPVYEDFYDEDGELLPPPVPMY